MKAKAISANDFSAVLGVDVSRETIERLSIYAELLRNWQQTHNLVAASTLPHIWTRHFADCWQVSEFGPLDAPWLDLGSGAGFPGLIVALAMQERHTKGFVDLVESNQRKAAFLREVIRATGAPARVHAKRFQDVREFGDPSVSVVTARAFASLSALCGYVQPFVDKGAIALLPKGQDIDSELTEATRYWNIDYQSFPSRTEQNSVILRVNRLSRKG